MTSLTEYEMTNHGNYLTFLSPPSPLGIDALNFAHFHVSPTFGFCLLTSSFSANHLKFIHKVCDHKRPSLISEITMFPFWSYAP